MIRSFKPALALILCAVTISYAGDWNVGVGGNTARNCQFDAFGPADAELLWSGGNYAQYSSQAVIEGDYVLMHRRENPDDTFHGTPLLAYDLHTGEELWSTELPVIDEGTERYNKISGVLNGQVYASRSGGYSNPAKMYALDITDGSIIWVSDDIVTETMTESVSFAENGDLIAGNYNDILRINHQDGSTVWQVYRSSPSSDASAVAVFGDRGYTWESAATGPKIGVYDLTAGDHLYSSPSLSPGYVQQTGPMVGPDGTVYAPRTHNNPNDDYFVSLEDTGEALVENWRVEYAYALGASHGVGPDGTIYTYSRDNEVIRLDPETGEVLNTSIQIAEEDENFAFWPRMAIGADGIVYVTNGQYLNDQVFSFTPDLTLRWSEAITGIGTGGPAVGRDGTMVICAKYEEVRAYVGQGAATVRPDVVMPDFTLKNYPNPFNPSTTIEFTLTRPQDVRLEVYNIKGQLVRVLANGQRSAGTHTVSFNADNLTSGVYLYRLKTGADVVTRKMILVK